mgnify:CR=1 FL=1
MQTVNELFNSGYTVDSSLEFWEKQVDGSVFNNVNDEEWMNDQIGNIEVSEESIKKWIWNPTSVGNIAYIAVHCPFQEHKNKCIAIFNMVKKLSIQNKTKPKQYENKITEFLHNI